MNRRRDDLEVRLTELVIEWRERIAAGQCPSPAEMCRDCPELTDEFLLAIDRLKTVDQFLSSQPKLSSFSTTIAGEPLEVPGGFPDVPGYRLLEEIGRGGMGVVYKARQESLDRLVAIKTLPGGRWGQSGFIARLRQEAKSLSLLAHPNVVKVIDVVETPAAVSIILEYVEGESLARRLKRAAMQPSEAARMTLKLARALAFVHARGLLHRDIKPANILIDLSGEIRIADFGLVKEQGSHASLTETGDWFGTPSYMAPEQLQGKDALVDTRSDVYSLGATMYEMLTGRAPFVGISTLDILDQVQHREPIAVRMLSPGVPRDLETLCLKCLDKDPGRRFANAEELVAELERFEQGIPIRSRPIGIAVRCRRWCRRRPAVAALGGFLVIAVVVILGLLTVYNRDLTRLNANLTRLNEDLDLAATKAKSLQQIAEERERQANHSLYAADVNRAAIAWRQNDTRVLTTLLDRHLPQKGQLDNRGFAWWFLYHQAKPTYKTLLATGAPQYLICHSKNSDDWVVAGLDATVRFFDVETGRVKKQIVTGQIEVNGLAFSPDGQEIATAGDDGTVRICNLRSLQERLKIPAHPGKAFQLVYTSDGTQIIVCGDNPVIRAFNSESGEPLYVLDGHQNIVQSLLYDEESHHLISTANDHEVRVWNLDRRSLKSVFRTSGDVGPVAIDRKRQLLFIGNSEGVLQTVNLRENREVASVKHLDKIESLALRPDGMLLATGDSSGQLRLRKVDAAGNLTEDQFQPWQAHEGIVYSLVWSIDGSQLISTGKDGEVRCWNLAALNSTIPTAAGVRMSTGSGLIPHTTSLLGKSESQLVRWDWKRNQLLARSVGQNLFSPSVSPDGLRFVAIKISDPERTSDELALYELPINSADPLDARPVSSWRPQGSLQNARFSPDSQSIAVSRWHRAADEEVEDHTIWLVNVPKMDETVRIPVLFAKNAIFSPDGKRLLITTRTDVVLWSISENRTIWSIPNNYVETSSFSSDGTLVAYGGNDRQAYLADTTDGTIRFRLAGHRSRVRSVAFSPDGRMLATADGDGSVKFWHVANGQELLEIPNPGGYARHLEFTSDGNHLIYQFELTNPESNERTLIFDGSTMD